MTKRKLTSDTHSVKKMRKKSTQGSSQTNPPTFSLRIMDTSSITLLKLRQFLLSITKDVKRPSFVKVKNVDKCEGFRAIFVQKLEKKSEDRCLDVKNKQKRELGFKNSTKNENCDVLAEISAKLEKESFKNIKSVPLQDNFSLDEIQKLIFVDIQQDPVHQEKDKQLGKSAKIDKKTELVIEKDKKANSVDLIERAEKINIRNNPKTDANETVTLPVLYSSIFPFLKYLLIRDPLSVYSEDDVEVQSDVSIRTKQQNEVTVGQFVDVMAVGMWKFNEKNEKNKILSEYKEGITDLEMKNQNERKNGSNDKLENKKEENNSSTLESDQEKLNQNSTEFGTNNQQKNFSTTSSTDIFSDLQQKFSFEHLTTQTNLEMYNKILANLFSTTLPALSGDLKRLESNYNLNYNFVLIALDCEMLSSDIGLELGRVSMIKYFLPTETSIEELNERETSNDKDHSTQKTDNKEKTEKKEKTTNEQNLNETNSNRTNFNKNSETNNLTTKKPPLRTETLDLFAKPQGTVTDYKTEFSGLTAELVAGGEPFETVQEKVLQFVWAGVENQVLESDISVEKSNKNTKTLENFDENITLSENSDEISQNITKNSITEISQNITKNITEESKNYEKSSNNSENYEKYNSENYEKTSKKSKISDKFIKKNQPPSSKKKLTIPILLGHSLYNDLSILRLYHPFLIDTSRLYRTRSNYKISLKLLAQKYLDNEIQVSTHSSMEDAKACVGLLTKRVHEIQLIVDAYCKEKDIHFEFRDSESTKRDNNFEEKGNIEKDNEKCRKFSDENREKNIEKCRNFSEDKGKFYDTNSNKKNILNFETLTVTNFQTLNFPANTYTLVFYESDGRVRVVLYDT